MLIVVVLFNTVGQTRRMPLKRLGIGRFFYILEIYKHQSHSAYANCITELTSLITLLIVCDKQAVIGVTIGRLFTAELAKFGP